MRPSRRDPAEGAALRDTLAASLPEGLVPLRMQTPEVNEGLHVLSFSDGLEELSVDGMRRGPRRNKNAPGAVDPEGMARYRAIAATDL